MEGSDMELCVGGTSVVFSRSRILLLTLGFEQY